MAKKRQQLKGPRKVVRARRPPRGCADKTPYPTAKAAEVAVARREREGVEGLGAYFCSYCENFHIGHPPLPKRLTS